MSSPLADQRKQVDMSITLIGIDAGLRDTAAVALMLDPNRKKFSVDHEVWSDVTRVGEDKMPFIDPVAMDEIRGFTEHDTYAHVYIEGFRPRGRDTIKDKKMMSLVQDLKRNIEHSHVVDNTEIKKIVTEPLLKLFQMHRFPGTYHSDTKSAARVALRGGTLDGELNMLLATFVRDNLGGLEWSRV